MKRTTTEIFIEIEETFAVRREKESSNGAEKAAELTICPLCGEAFPNESAQTLCLPESSPQTGNTKQEEKL